MFRQACTTRGFAALLLTGTTLAGPALAQNVGSPAIAGSSAESSAAPDGEGTRSSIPDLEGAEPSNLPEQLENPKAANVTITGHVLEPKAVEPNAERVSQLGVPDGFSVSIFAEDLGKPRMIAVADDGTLYVTDREAGKVTMLKDEDGDGTAETKETVAEREKMHGIALDGDTAYLMTVNTVFSAPINEDGTLGELIEIATDFPEGGQHPNRTLVVGPDDMLYVSVGSTCNACGETNEENATLVRMAKDGSSREIFASGLRNTIGFGFEPESGRIYGFDHGIDWLGDDEQPEEFNLIEEGKQYGWPYVYADSKINPQDEPPQGTPAEWAEKSAEPVLMYTPHAAPMQMTFNDSEALPSDMRGDAFVAMRGSWNRKPPSGYEVVRVDFENGEPQSIEPFLTGFLSGDGEDWTQMGRLAGLATGPDGAMYLSDDTNGVIYRIAPERSEDEEQPASSE